jgi:hypothetical protein
MSDDYAKTLIEVLKEISHSLKTLAEHFVVDPDDVPHQPDPESLETSQKPAVIVLAACIAGVTRKVSSPHCHVRARLVVSIGADFDRISSWRR